MVVIQGVSSQLQHKESIYLCFKNGRVILKKGSDRSLNAICVKSHRPAAQHGEIALILFAKKEILTFLLVRMSECAEQHQKIDLWRSQARISVSLGMCPKKRPRAIFDIF